MNSHPKTPIQALQRTGTRALAVFLLLAVVADVRADVVFRGLDDRQEQNVRALSTLATTECDSARWRVERLYRDADKNIRDALRALGYYDTTITKTLRWSDDCWHAEFDIEVGEPVRFRDINIDIVGEASSDIFFQNRIANGRPTPGAVFDHGQYSDFKSTVLRAATNTGFFDLDLKSSKVTVDKDARTADVLMRINSGDKYKFGDVKFSEGILHDYVLQGYTDIRPGDPYTAKSINDLYEALSGSSYFSSVSIRTEPLDTTGKIVPVTVDLTPAKRRVYSFGGGFTTDTGPHGRIGFANRRINQKGHQFESKLFASTVLSELNASYRWPKRDPRREWFSIVTGFQHEKTDTSEQDSFKLGFLRSKSLGTRWLQTRYVDFAYEDFTVGDQSSTSELIIFGTNFESAVGRALSRATEGYRLSFDLRGASDNLGSDTTFAQLRAKAKWVYSFGDKTRFLARTSLGITAKDSLSDLPASVRFFAGGDNSVRGYDFESLGPRDASGAVIGGSHLIDVSLEIDRLFRDKWAVALFVDGGDAFNDTHIKMSTGVGIGVRWYSPVGPIRLDFAHPLDDPDKDFRIHISLGPDL
jgi:translocation and assembly module TamA